MAARSHQALSGGGAQATQWLKFWPGGDFRIVRIYPRFEGQIKILSEFSYFFSEKAFTKFVGLHALLSQGVPENWNLVYPQSFYPNKKNNFHVFWFCAQRENLLLLDSMRLLAGRGVPCTSSLDAGVRSPSSHRQLFDRGFCPPTEKNEGFCHPSSQPFGHCNATWENSSLEKFRRIIFDCCPHDFIYCAIIWLQPWKGGKQMSCSFGKVGVRFFCWFFWNAG